MPSARAIALRLADDPRPSMSNTGRPPSSRPTILAGTNSVLPSFFS